MTLIGIIYHRQERDYVEEKVNYIKEIKLLNSSIIKLIDNSDFMKKFETFNEKVTYSDPMSPNNAREVEQKIINSLEVLKTKIENNNYLEADNLLTKVDNLLDERNSICMMK